MGSSEMSKVKVSWCYLSGYDRDSYNSILLNIFVDSSEEIDAAVANFWIEVKR